MKNTDHYTETDFQDYLDRDFKGDILLFESHVKSCAHCSNALKASGFVNAYIKNDFKVEPLRIDLASSVAGRVFNNVKPASPIAERMMYALLFILGTICAAVTARYLIEQAVPAYFLLLLIPAVLYLVVSLKEIKMMNHKFHGMT